MPFSWSAWPMQPFPSAALTTARTAERSKNVVVCSTSGPRARTHFGTQAGAGPAPGGRQGRKPSPRFLGIAPPDQGRSLGAEQTATPARRHPAAGSVTPLLTATTAIMLRRCEPARSISMRKRSCPNQDWRIAMARELSVPAYVVFTDNTLIAIAESLPTDDTGIDRDPGYRRPQARAVRQRRTGTGTPPPVANYPLRSRCCAASSGHAAGCRRGRGYS